MLEKTNRKTPFQNGEEEGVDYCNQERLYDALLEPLGPKLELFWSTIVKHLKMIRVYFSICHGSNLTDRLQKIE